MILQNMQKIRLDNEDNEVKLYFIIISGEPIVHPI